ncbi:hypothetical protein [Slackia piriformis]|uniref:hypothetical protein n=1 Tax=Slackia piriformis TaxID=626934 RepID=UPI0026DA9698|nr:hypothetical protein [Slackia piriformis]MDO5023360.1 hypothetical protein [Slackia piriformis]
MEPKYEKMTRQMRADDVSEAMIARLVAKKMEETGSAAAGHRGDRDVAGVEEGPEHIRELLLANALCRN